MSEFILERGIVKDIENENSPYINDGKHELDKPYDGLRIRVEIQGKDKPENGDPKNLPWAFPLLPKTFQSIPKRGETVLVLYDVASNGQRYYIGPIISQPQFNSKCDNPKDASSLLNVSDHNIPLERVSNDSNTFGAFPKHSDVAVIGRGREDILMRYDDNTKASEIQLRAGVRSEPTNDPNPNMKGNIIFNGTDPAYIQLKYKNSLTNGQDTYSNSIINVVANRINIMSNKDNNIAHNLGDKKNMIDDEKMDDIMGQLHQVPKGDKLVELLEIMKGCILNHEHPWAGIKQCGDRGGFIKRLNEFKIKEDILSKYVRIS